MIVNAVVVGKRLPCGTAIVSMVAVARPTASNSP